MLNGTRLEGAPPGTTNRLYKNNRDGTFTDVTEKAGLTRTGWASAVTVGDYDNDGFDDLFITYYGHNVLYHNNGDGTFTDVTEKAGLRESRGALRLRLHLGGLRPRRAPGPVRRQLPRHDAREAAQARRERGLPLEGRARELRSARPAAPGSCGSSTTTATGPSPTSVEQSGVAAASGSYPMTAVAADYDNDGWPDIYVACDSTPSWLFRNQHDGTFRQEGLERGVALSEDGLEQAGMGVAVGDYDLDGNLDIFKTHFSDDTNVLYRNDGKGYFDDVTIRAGPGRGDPLRRLGHGDGRSRQRRLPRPVRGHRAASIPRWSGSCPPTRSGRRGWSSATSATAGSRS